MAIYTGQVTVGTTPTAIDGADRNPMRIIIHNMDNTKALYIGTNDVSTTTGLEVDKHGMIEITLNPNETIYAITDIGTVQMSYFKQVY